MCEVLGTVEPFFSCAASDFYVDIDGEKQN